MAFTNAPLNHASRCQVLTPRSAVLARAVAAPTRPVKSAVPELLDGRLAEQSSVNFHEYTQATQMLNRLKGQASDLELLLDQLNALEASLDDTLLTPPSLEEPDDRAARQAKRAAKRAERRAKATTEDVMRAMGPTMDTTSQPSTQSASRAASNASASNITSRTIPSLITSAVSDVEHLEELFKLTVGEPELPPPEAAAFAPATAAPKAPPLAAPGPVLRPKKAATKKQQPSATPAPVVAAPAPPPPAPAPAPGPPAQSAVSVSKSLDRLFHHDFSYDNDAFWGRAGDPQVGPSDEDLRALERQVENLSQPMDDADAAEEQGGQQKERQARDLHGSRELEQAALAPRRADQVSMLPAGPSLLSLVPSAPAGRSARLSQARRSARHGAARGAGGGVGTLAAGAVRGRVAGNDGTDQFLHSSTSVNILSADAEREVTAMCQDYLFLEKVKRQCEKTLHRKATKEECAAAVGMDALSYNARFDAGLKAKEYLLKSNYRLVMTVCKRYIGKGMHLQDLVSEGVKGLLRGVEMYDASRGFRFGTYAQWWIRQAVSRSMAETGRAVRLPVHMIEQLTKLKSAGAALAMELNREPTVQELAAAVGLPVSRVELVLDAARAASSMESAVGGDDGLTVKDAVQDDRMAADEAFGSDTLRADVEGMLEELGEREAAVLRLRFGLEDGVEWTLEDIGSRLGVTRERIRQLEAKALRKLQIKTIDVRGKLKDYSENLNLLESHDVAARTSSGTRKT